MTRVKMRCLICHYVWYDELVGAGQRLTILVALFRKICPKCQKTSGPYDNECEISNE